MDEYRMYRDVAVAESTEELFVNVALHKDALETSKRAGLCPSVQTLAGSLGFGQKISRTRIWTPQSRCCLSPAQEEVEAAAPMCCPSHRTTLAA